MTRIGIDATFLEASALYTGMGVYTRGLLGGLAELSSQHELVLLGYGPRPESAPAGLRWHRLPLLPFGRLSAWLSHQLVLGRAVHRLGLDVLHLPGVNLRLSQPSIPLRLPCPLVVTLHDVIPLVYYGQQGPPLPWRLRLGYLLALQAARRASLIVTVSETSKRDILAQLRLEPERIQVVYNGLDRTISTSASNREQTLRQLGVPTQYLLYAGSYEPRKNLICAVDAYRRALARRDLPPLVLIVERESGHRASVMSAVASLGVSDRLHFVHSLTDADLAALYRGASLFIYPSLYEGFGFAPLQALAAGVPVLASALGSLPEVLGDAAHFVDPIDPERLATAIVHFVDHPAEAAALAARGPARASRFTWDRAARSTLEIYEQAARSGPRGVLAPSARHDHPAHPPRRRRWRSIVGVLLIVLLVILMLVALGGPNAQRPDPSQAQAATSPAPTPTPVLSEQRLLLTYFFYWYDATTGAHLETGHGLRHHLPAQPTPSWRNPAWFKKELQDMAAAGIDVVLPVYWGFDRPDDAWSTQGLAVLAQAWQELASEGHQPPRIGLFLDTTIVAWRDLTTPAGMAWFAATFQDFFHRIPREQWATVDGRPIAFLFTSDWTAAVNQATFDYVYAQFQAEFGVRPYLVREVSWDYPILRWEHGQRVRDYQHPITTDNSYLWAAAVHGYIDWGGVAAVGPGYDDHLVPGRGKGTIKDREDGAFYRRSFEAAVASGKPLIAIETWNEIHEGSGISETREFGRQYIDLTRELADQFHGVSR